MKYLLTLLLALGLLITPATVAQASTTARSGDETTQTHRHGHWGESARKVSKEIGCKKFKRMKREYRSQKSLGRCRLKGFRVYLATFDTRAAQKSVSDTYYSILPEGSRWAVGKGAIIYGHGMNKKGARLGAKALHGRVRHIPRTS